MRAERNRARQNAGAPARLEMHRGAAAAPIEAAIRAGSKLYDRVRDLPALIRSQPRADEPETPDSIAAIVARLERALRAEHGRARSGHWTYDLNRHIALRQAFRAETERLALVKRAHR